MPRQEERWPWAIWTVVGVAGTLVAADLVQVAVTAPGSLTPVGVATLAGLYLGSAAVAAVPCAVAVALLRLTRPVSALRATLLAAGAFFLLQEVALRRLPPLSPWRPWAVLAIGVLSVVAVIPLARLRVGRLAGVAVAVLLAIGAVGAVRGFGAPAEQRSRASDTAGRLSADDTRPNVI